VVFLLKGLAEIVTVVHVVACVSAWLLVELSAHESEAIRITVEIYNKTATRLPEALWIDFNPWTNETTTDITGNKFDSYPFAEGSGCLHDLFLLS